MLTILLLAAHAGAASGASKEAIKKEKRLEDVNRKIREEKKAVESALSREQSILAALESINKELTAKRDELDMAERELAKAEAKTRAVADAIGRLETERAALAGRLRDRLRAMYKMRKGALLAAVFSTGTPDGLGRRHKYLTIIMDSDSILIDNYEKNLEALAADRVRLSGLTNDLEDARENALQKRDEAEAVKKDKTALLGGVKRERARRQKVLKELETAAAELTGLISKLRGEEAASQETGGFAAMKGRLAMPVDGKVVSSYGKVRNPKFNTEVFNNGIIIEARLGAPVKSVYEGKVVYVGWLKGYGQVMIIDNNGGFYTLFAQLSKVLRDNGAAVASGDTVALVGDTGATGNAGLYFEIRQRGVPRDPEAWLAARQPR
ncbi:MAG: peptidoglycan DD-metalloendopeptidase family protein [Deltaproteobacteria bacterium]|nr:peptidoglycan DD-metalloendopeptidase family protein [Deltaproteobacteria bacterium]